MILSYTQQCKTTHINHSSIDGVQSVIMYCFLDYLYSTLCATVLHFYIVAIFCPFLAIQLKEKLFCFFVSKGSH